MSVYTGALERGKKQPINCKKEMLVSVFLQGTVREQEQGQKKAILKKILTTRGQKCRRGNVSDPNGVGLKSLVLCSHHTI